MIATQTIGKTIRPVPDVEKTPLVADVKQQHDTVSLAVVRLSYGTKPFLACISRFTCRVPKLDRHVTFVHSDSFHLVVDTFFGCLNKY